MRRSSFKNIRNIENKLFEEIQEEINYSLI